MTFLTTGSYNSHPPNSCDPVHITVDNKLMHSLAVTARDALYPICEQLMLDQLRHIKSNLFCILRPFAFLFPEEGLQGGVGGGGGVLVGLMCRKIGHPYHKCSCQSLNHMPEAQATALQDPNLALVVFSVTCLRENTDAKRSTEQNLSTAQIAWYITFCCPVAGSTSGRRGAA